MHDVGVRATQDAGLPISESMFAGLRDRVYHLD